MRLESPVQDPPQQLHLIHCIQFTVVLFKAHQHNLCPLSFNALRAPMYRERWAFFKRSLGVTKSLLVTLTNLFSQIFQSWFIWLVLCVGGSERCGLQVAGLNLLYTQTWHQPGAGRVLPLWRRDGSKPVWCYLWVLCLLSTTSSMLRTRSALLPTWWCFVIWKLVLWSPEGS